VYPGVLILNRQVLNTRLIGANIAIKWSQGASRP